MALLSVLQQWWIRAGQQGFPTRPKGRILPTVLAQPNDLSAKVRSAVTNLAFLEEMVNYKSTYKA